MSPIALRALIRRRRRHTAVLLLVCCLGGAVAVHHAGPAVGAGHHDGDMAAMVDMCVAAFTAIGAAVVVVGLGLLALGRWRPVMSLGLGAQLVAARPPRPRARAGPSLLCLLCVSRR